MAYYKVTLGYKTKRGGVAMGMTVKAFEPDEAVELVKKHHLYPYKARQFCFSDVREADADDIALGVANP